MIKMELKNKNDLIKNINDETVFSVTTIDLIAKVRRSIKRGLERETLCYRELNILNNFNRAIISNNNETADIYSKDDSFQIVIEPFNSHLIGDITG